MITFNLKYFLIGLILFVIEVLIAIFVHDGFVRPYFGDYLVVILIYCVVRIFLNASPFKIAIGVLLFSCILETLQYFNFVDKIGLGNNKIARTVIGQGFSWIDLFAYTLGIGTVLLLEGRRKRVAGKE